METIKETEQESVFSAAQFFTYEEYKALVIALFEKNKVTGDVQNEDKLEATKINLTRIKRWDKTFKINEELQLILSSLKKQMIWYIISEGWCGDSAQLLPAIVKITEATPNIELKILLRDDNSKIMDNYLTNGGAAIPKLIAVDKATNSDLFTWGPRPIAIYNKVQAYKQEFTLDNKDEFNKNLHLWYARDKGQAIQKDFIQLLKFRTLN